jgi:hypothetical protein
VFLPLVVVGFLPLLVGLYILAYVVARFDDAVAVFRTPLVSVYSLSEGLDRPVALTGTVEPVPGEDSLSAPLSGREAVAVEHEVDERRSDGDGSTSWHRRERRRAAVPFVLDDGTAGVRVDPSTATLSLATDEVLVVDADESVPDALRALAEASDVDADPRLLDLGPFEVAMGNARRFTERCLCPGDDVTVVGVPTYARGGVDEVNAVVDSGSPFVVADATPRTVAARIALTWSVHLLSALVMFVVGGAVIYGGMVVVA